MDAFKNALLFDFNNYDELLKCLYIMVKFETHGLESLSRITSAILGRNLTSVFLDAFYSHCKTFSDFNPLDFRKTEELDQKIATEFVNVSIEQTIIVPQSNVCINCNCELSINRMRLHSASLISYSSNVKDCKIGIKECFCGSLTYPSYSIKGGTRKIFESIFEDIYISFTEETIFEQPILNVVLSDIVFKQSSFMGFAQAHNSLWSSDEMKRDLLTDKRLSEVWFYFNCCKIYKEMNGTLTNENFVNMVHLDSMLVKMKPYLFRFFVTKWSKHVNTHHTLCSKALVIDGNQKVRRMVCCFEEVYKKMEYIGEKKMGCVETPLKGNFLKEILFHIIGSFLLKEAIFAKSIKKRNQK